MVSSDQLTLQSEQVLHVDLGENTDELLQRCILSNCRFSIRVPIEASQAIKGAEERPVHVRIKPTTSYDLAQILSDIYELYLENRARISFRVCLLL